MSHSDVLLSDDLNEKAWKEYRKINFKGIIESILKQKDEILDIVEESSGLRFENIEYEFSGKSANDYDDRIRIIIFETKTPLGFIGNYIKEVKYDLYSDGARMTKYNPVTNEFEIYFNASISYTHHDGGGNGVSDWKFRITFNTAKNKLEFVRFLK
jgi:hypothetical protein